MNDRSERPPAQYTRLLAALAQAMRRGLKTQRELLPTAFLFKDTELVKTIVSVFQTDADKDQMAQTIRQYASRFGANAIAFVHEGWGLPPAYQTDEGYAAIQERYGEIANCPFRTDLMNITLETYDGYWRGSGEIKPAKKGRKVGGLEWHQALRAGGRFTHMLPVRHPTPAQVDAYLALARRKMVAAGLDPDAPMATGKTMLDHMEAKVRQAPIERMTEPVLDDLIAMVRRVKSDPPPHPIDLDVITTQADYLRALEYGAQLSSQPDLSPEQEAQLMRLSRLVMDYESTRKRGAA